MARDEPVAAPSAGLEDDDEVDLSFAGPEPVAAAPWPLRLLDLVSAYLPLLMMAVLAAGNLVAGAQCADVEAPRAEVAPPRHEPDYAMTRFVVQRFASDGALRTQIEGERLRHYPDDDTLEIDQARIRAVGSDGVVTIATAKRALANGDGSEVQLLGDAHVVAAGARQARRRSSSAASSCTRSATSSGCARTCRSSSRRARASFRADGMEYDNLARVVDLKGRTQRDASSTPRRAAAP